MTELFRQQVREEMSRQGISQRELAERLNLYPQQLWNMLNGDTSNLPRRWHEVLDELGLEVVVQAKNQS